MNKKSTAQYQQNIDIIKSFFRKPVVLVAGILTLVATLCQSVVSYIMAPTVVQYWSQHVIDLYSQFSFLIEEYEDVISVGFSSEQSFSLDLFTIALGIAFILLFAHGRSNSNNIQGSAKYFKVLATIEYIISFVVVVFAILIVIITIASDFPVEYKINISMIVIAIGAFIFLAGFSKLRFSKAICNSMNSIYLDKTGSILFAVISFVKAMVSLVVLALLLSLAVVGSVIADGFDVPWLFTYPLVALLTGVFNLFYGILASKYNRYICGVTNGTIEMPADKEDEKEKICIVCGSPLTEEDVFCSVCGNKVE